MKNSERLEKAIEEIAKAITPFKDAIGEGLFLKITKEIEKIQGYKNDLDEVESELDDAQGELRDAEKRIDDMELLVEAQEEENENRPMKALTLYDEQKIEILERIYKTCNLEDIIELENLKFKKVINM